MLEHNYGKFFKKFSKIVKNSKSITKPNYISDKLGEQASIFLKKTEYSNSDSPVNNYSDNISLKKKLFKLAHNESKTHISGINPNPKTNFLDIISGEKNTNPRKHKYSNDAINNPYRKKIQEYLLSDRSLSSEYVDNFSYNLDLDSDLKQRVFLNNSWSIDNYRKPVYDLPLVGETSDYVFDLSEIKDNLNLNFEKSVNLIKPMWSSRNSRKFQDVRGFKNYGTDWPLSYRMHALILPKYSENPIFVSDEEANREYSEVKNSNFSRRLNDLEVMGDGFIRELEYFREFNLNPLELGRFYSSPNWEEDEDKVDKHRPSKHLQQKYNNWKHYKKEPIMVGHTESSSEFEDVLLNSGYAGNFKIAGGDSQKNLFISDLGNKFYDIIDTNYFQKKINWYSPSVFFNKKKSPWGFDFDNKLNWYGSQHWSLQKNLSSFSELFETQNYRVSDLEDPDIDTYLREYIKFNKKDEIFNFLKNKNNSTTPEKPNQSWRPYRPYLKNYNSWNFNNYEKIPEYAKFHNVRFHEDDEEFMSEVLDIEHPNLSNTDIISNNEVTQYSFLISPENYFSTVDRDFNSELKHEWRTKFFQYGKMFRSLEQSTVLQDYYSNFITLSNRALTPRQIGDYFWMMYKPYKKNKYSKFLKNYELIDRESSVNHKLHNQPWDIKIGNPTNLQGVAIFGDNEGFNDKSGVFPNLGKNWLSVYFKKKMSQNRQNFSINQLETYNGPEFSFENINTIDVLKKKTKKYGLVFLDITKMLKPQLILRLTQKVGLSFLGYWSAVVLPPIVIETGDYLYLKK